MLITMVVAIIWLVTKGNEKEQCGNILLVTATLCAVSGLSSTPMMNYVQSRHEIASLEALDKKPSVIDKADKCGLNIERAQAASMIKEKFPPLAWLPKVFSLEDETKARTEAERFFVTMKPKDREVAGIKLRRAILEHELGTLNGSELKESNRYRLKKQSNSNLPTDIGDDADTKNLLSLLKNSKDPEPKPDLPLKTDGHESVAADSQTAADARLVEAQLPEGWFRYSLLHSLYKNAGTNDKLALLEATRTERINERLNKLVGLIVASVVSLIVGVAALIAFARVSISGDGSSLIEDEADPVKACTLKRFYSFGLMIYYVQFAVGLPLGFMLGLINGSSAAAMKASTTYLLYAEQLTNIVSVPVAINYMICLPLALKLSSFLIRPTTIRFPAMLAWSVGGFFALRSLLWLYVVVIILILKNFPAPDNHLQQKIVEAANSNNIIDVILLWIAIAVVAPIVEEIIFRRLLYGILRYRFGIARGAVLSAIVFSCCHLDVNVLITHFVIGLALAIIYERTRSLIPCIITHMLWNTSVIMYAWLLN